MYELFRFLSKLIPAAVILLPIMFYYLHKRNLLKTKKEIRQAFAELMSRKPIEEISISDISAEALINRKTAENEVEKASTVDQLGEIQRLLARLTQSIQPKGASEA